MSLINKTQVRAELLRKAKLTGRPFTRVDSSVYRALERELDTKMAIIVHCANTRRTLRW